MSGLLTLPTGLVKPVVTTSSSFVDIATSGADFSGGSPRIKALPVGFVAGDLLVCYCVTGGTSLSGIDGFTALTSDGTPNFSYVFWKVADGTETVATVRSGSNGFTLAYAMLAYRGGATLSLVESVAASATTSTDEGGEIATLYFALADTALTPADVFVPGGITQRGSNVKGTYFSSLVSADEGPTVGAVPVRTFTGAQRVYRLTIT